MITNLGLFWVSLERVAALRRFYLIFKVPLYALRTTGIPTQQMWEKATPLTNTLSIIVKTYHIVAICTQVLIDLIDTAQATECTLFIDPASKGDKSSLD